MSASWDIVIRNLRALYDTSLKLDCVSDPTKHAQSLDHKALTKTAHH